jgi:hypothetical protein
MIGSVGVLGEMEKSRGIKEAIVVNDESQPSLTVQRLVPKGKP